MTMALSIFDRLMAGLEAGIWRRRKGSYQLSVISDQLTAAAADQHPTLLRKAMLRYEVQAASKERPIPK